MRQSLAIMQAPTPAADPDLLLYYNRISICSSMARLLIRERALRFTERHVDLMSGEQLAPWFLRLNPLGEVPVLVARGAVVPDSQALTYHLETTRREEGVRLIPDDRDGEVRAWLSAVHALPFFRITLSTNRDAAPTDLVAQAEARREVYRGKIETLARENEDLASVYRAKLARSEQEKPAVVSGEQMAAAWGEFERFFDRLEEQLRQSGTEAPYVLGAYTAVDAHVTPVFSRITARGRRDLIEARPAVASYWARVRARPSFAEVFDTPCGKADHPALCVCR